MSGRILIVDSVATNRIVLKVALVNAQYLVRPAASLAEARDVITLDRPDLILVEISNLGADALHFLTALRGNTETVDIPVIAMGHFGGTDARVAALQAGADDALEKPLNHALLLARIRRLLRERDASSELRLREDTNRALGFAESTDTFERPQQVALVSPRSSDAVKAAHRLSAATGAKVEACDPTTALAANGLEPPPEVFVIDAQSCLGPSDDGQIFRLLADLRSRSHYRHCAQLLIAPEDGDDIAAMALDLGANDVVRADAGAQEIGVRIARLGRQKSQLDRLRDTVQCGLRAAITDPLTGLYNRRYALPHLATLAEEAKATGQDLAIMVLDIDHFKQINDTLGHAAGDKVLVALSKRLKDNLRAIDLVARIGGEEFLVAMPDTSAEHARGAAERIRRLINDTPFDAGSDARQLLVTASIGVAVGQTVEQLDGDVIDIVGRADAALYDAKSSGRNMVTVSQSAA